jgi:hypothetical protein
MDSALLSRASSASYQSSQLSDDSSAPVNNRYSLGSFGDRPLFRRGFSRPEGTDFAASAKHRDSVLSLGSIAHIQYYFARTGLLDGKGAQLARKRNPRATLDLSSLDSSSFLTPKAAGSDVDSSYASMGSSPDLGAQTLGAVPLMESPIAEQDEFFPDEYRDPDAPMLPPTTSTYKKREVIVEKPPTIAKLRSDLTSALNAATKGLQEAHALKGIAGPSAPTPPGTPGRSPKPPAQGFYQVQGMQILDFMTLAIRAAKLFYTSHDQPDRLDTIKSEKEIRTDLLSLMEVLKRMATRNFNHGMKDEEFEAMSSWLESIRDLLKREQEIEECERKERLGWTWLKGDWTDREIEREIAFLTSMDTEADPLPPYTPIDPAGTEPTPFLKSFQNGLRLVKLHNAAVHKSQKRFGCIGPFHTDTQKPYRCAENLRYWIKAAELRWETMLKVDVLGVVYNNNPQVWVDFEAAIWKWCQKVREEVTAELEKENSD